MERRVFVKNIGRGIVLSGLIGLSGAILFKGGEDEAGVCDYDFICNNCKKKSKCKLPEAEKYKKEKNK